jgi:NAD(P)-dependent dehydrogenase (short-subunit alcohol dehydrogenase family)
MARWVVVLGASSGMGAATARAFAAAGLGVLGVHFDLRATAARADVVREACVAAGVPVVFHNGNAADERQRAAALDALRAADPDADVAVVVHSLAFGTLKPMVGPPGERLAPRDLTMTLDVMAHSLVHWVTDLLDRDLLHEGARVLALTSSGSLVAMPSYGAVSAAKAALEAHVRQLAVELAPRRITVNAVMAGLCRTPALERIPGWERLAAAAEARNPSGRLTQPDDVARALVALSDTGLGWMTGNVVRVDGGETISV